MINALVALYASHGLGPISAGGGRLSKRCPRCEGCWPAARQNEILADPALDIITLPWIGSRYHARRVALVGMNFDRWGGWGAHWAICEDHQRSMAAGRRGKAGRAFGLGAMRYVET